MGALDLKGSPTGAIAEPRTQVPPAARRVLAADVSALSLAEILGWIEVAGKSGFLDFGFRDHEKAVFFRDGEVVFARSNQRFDRLGECLLRSGVISLAQLRAAEQRYQPPGRFGKVFVEVGFLTPQELWKGVKDQVEEIVRSLFAYSSGVVHFFDGDVQPDNVVRLSLPTRRLVAEGVQRREELRRFLSALEDPRVRVLTVEGTRQPLSGEERTLFDALEREPSFPAVCQALALEPLAAARGVQLLRLVGAMKLIRSPAEAADARAEPVRP